MKITRRIAVFLLTLCLTVPCFSMLTYAADGKIMFLDPSTAVGQTLELKGVVQANQRTDAIGKIHLVMSYDTSMLRFNHGEGVTETSEGQLTYELDNSNPSYRVEFLMYFDVIKEGTTQVTADGYDITLTNNQALNCQKGSSTITIAAGELPAESETPQTTTNVTAVNVDGVEYTISNSFPESEIPEGFEESTIQYNSVEYRALEQPSSGIVLVYLVDSQEVGEFFFYNTDDATFNVYEPIKISETTTITLLHNVSEVQMPASYTETTVTVNDTEFPAWQDEDNTDFCILYAVNNQGEKSLYQFDTVELTYQKFEVPEVVEDTTKDESFIIAKLNDIFGEHLDYVLLGVVTLFVIFLVLILVLSIKLYNRNAELDDLYDEYGIDLDDDEQEEQEQQERQQPVLNKPVMETVVPVEEEPYIQVYRFDDEDMEPVVEPVVEPDVLPVIPEPVVDMQEITPERLPEVMPVVVPENMEEEVPVVEQFDEEPEQIELFKEIPAELLADTTPEGPVVVSEFESFQPVEEPKVEPVVIPEAIREEMVQAQPENKAKGVEIKKDIDERNVISLDDDFYDEDDDSDFELNFIDLDD